MIMTTTNQRADELMKKVQDLKTSLQFTQKELDEFKANYSTLSSGCNSNINYICKLPESLLFLDTQANYLEGQYWCNKKVVDGILESPNEKWIDSEEKVKPLIPEKLKLDHNRVILERAHRTGKLWNSTRSRPIVVKFLRYKDKEAVLQRAKCLKDTNIYVNEDFPEAIRQKRKELLSAMRAAREWGKIALLHYNKLIAYAPSQAKNGTNMKPK